MWRGCDEKVLCTAFSAEDGVAWSPPRAPWLGGGLRRPLDWAQLGPGLPSEDRAAPSPLSCARICWWTSRIQSTGGRFPPDRAPAPRPRARPPAPQSCSEPCGHRVWTPRWFQDRCPAPRREAAPRRRGSGCGVFAGTVRKRRLDPGCGMTVGSGHVWGQLPRDLTEPDPAEVKQGLDAHSRGSRHWGRCTGESRNRGARRPRLSPGFWASWKL